MGTVWDSLMRYAYAYGVREYARRTSHAGESNALEVERTTKP